MSAWPIPLIPYLSGDVTVVGRRAASRNIAIQYAGSGNGINSPVLSPDRRSVAFGTKNPSSSKWEVKVTSVGANAGEPGTVVVSDAGHYINSAPWPVWDPDGSVLYYLKHSATSGYGGYEIRSVEPDGSNDTLLDSVAIQYAGAVWPYAYNLSVSPSGTWLAWTEQTATYPAGVQYAALTTMQTDGTSRSAIFSNSRYYLSQYYVSPGWLRGDDKLIFCDMSANPGGASGNNNWRRINANGSGGTLLEAETSFDHYGVTRYGLLSDDSAVVCLRRTNGTSAGWPSATTAVLSALAISGTFYDLNPDYDAAAWNNTYCRPGVHWDGGEWRIYYVADTGGGYPYVVASVLEDGTDFRVEHDQLMYPDWTN